MAHALPDVEVFDGADYTSLDRPLANGLWYWWSRFPGCLPTSDPNGPFTTKAEAVADECR